VVRFLGTTPQSSAIHPLLTSLCNQISHNYAKPFDAIPLELSNLANYFKKLLASATSYKPLFIFIDSLDQLSLTNSAHSLSWMPVTLPQYCKLVVTTLDDCFTIVETLHKMLESKKNFEVVEPLGEQLGHQVIHEMLSNISRTINPSQLDLIKSAMQNCNSALYVKLVFDQVRLWRSYSTDLIIRQSIEDMIEEVFARVETAHGKVS